MLEAIKNRRSVRFYKPEPVSDEIIEEIIKAGFCAPSAHAAKRWHVIVVKDQAVKDQLAGIHPYSKVVGRAPVVFVVCVEHGDFGYFWVDDGAAFMENMLIQATELGLGTCWIGIHGLESDGRNAEEIVRGACNLPDNFGVAALALLGYSARYPGAHEPAIPEGRVHYDRFQ